MKPISSAFTYRKNELTLVCPKCGRVAMDSVVQVMRNEKGTFRYRVFRHPRVKQKAGVKHVKRCYVRIDEPSRIENSVSSRFS